jgi:hypothetical protein
VENVAIFRFLPFLAAFLIPTRQDVVKIKRRWKRLFNNT